MKAIILLIAIIVFIIPQSIIPDSFPNSLTAPSNEQQTYLLEQKWNYTNSRGIRKVSLSGDGTRLAVGCSEIILYFNTQTNIPEWAYDRPHDLVDSLDMTENGKYFAVGMELATLLLFESEEKAPYWRQRTGGPVLCLSISEDGEYLTFGTFYGSVYLANGKERAVQWIHQIPNNQTIIAVTISDDGKVVAAGTSDNRVLIFKRESPEPIFTFTTEGFIFSLDASPNGRYIACGSNDSSVYLFNSEKRELEWRFKTNRTVREVSISPDARVIAAGSYDHYIYLLRRESGDLVWSFRTEGLLKTVCITRDGERVFAGGTDKYLRILDVKTGRQLGSFKTSFWVNTLSPSSDGSYVAVGAGRQLFFIKLSLQDQSPSQQEKEKINKSDDTLPIAVGAILILSISAISIVKLSRSRWLRKRREKETVK
ncbi:WD40 repeat domain-containing protein [[Eubacterium] cellulosolvens]